jgi:hypothetical protein
MKRFRAQKAIFDSATFHIRERTSSPRNICPASPSCPLFETLGYSQALPERLVQAGV